MKIGMTLVVSILFSVFSVQSVTDWKKETIRCPTKKYSYRYSLSRSESGCRIDVQGDGQGVLILASAGNQTSIITIGKTPDGRPRFDEVTDETDPRTHTVRRVEFSFSRGDHAGRRNDLVDNPGQTADDVFAKACRPYTESLPPEVKSAFLGLSNFKVGS